MRTTNRKTSGANSTNRAVVEAHDKLVRAIESLVSSADWLRMLDVARRFHDYSPNNVLLILAQSPDATRVAGYATWRHLGRQVKSGERGVAILAPCLLRRSASEESTEDGEDAARRELRGFRVVHVFDVSQTCGRPLDEVAPLPLDGAAPILLWERLVAHLDASGFRLLRGACSPANGLTDHLGKTVVVRADLSPGQAVRTLAHEVAHVHLHDGTEYGRGLRNVVEIEAESVAYLVCASAGLDTDRYSLPYVARWADGDTDTIRRTADRVITCARSLLGAMDLVVHGSSSATSVVW